MGTPILHLGATVLCLHGGQAQPASPFPRVMVGGQPVVTQTSPYMVAGCPFTTASPQPCVTAQYVTASLRVRAGGAPVLLSASTAVCAPNGTGLNALVTQMRVTAS